MAIVKNELQKRGESALSFFMEAVIATHGDGVQEDWFLVIDYRSIRLGTILRDIRVISS